MKKKKNEKKVSPHNQVNRFIIITVGRKLRLSIVVPLNNGRKTFFFFSLSFSRGTQYVMTENTFFMA